MANAGQFKPGQSGNPRGRMPGVRGADNHTLLMMKAESMARQCSMRPKGFSKTT